MGLGRKRALQRLRDLLPELERHLNEIAEQPDSIALNHWRDEARNWLRQMKAVLRHVGKRTAAEWQPVIDRIEAALGEKSDES